MAGLEYQRKEVFLVQGQDDSGRTQAALVVRQTDIDGEGIRQQTHVIVAEQPARNALPEPHSQPAIREAPSYTTVNVEQRSCCGECWKCESGHKWYDFDGKGAGWIPILLLLYLIFGIIALVIWLIVCVLYYFSCSSDD